MAIEKEVIVKLSLTPDASAASKVAQIESSITKLQARASNIRVNLKSSGSSSMKNPLDDMVKQAEKNVTNIEKEVNQLTDKRIKAEERAARAAREAASKIQAAHIQALNASKQALGGILDMAQGLAILGISSEKDLAIFAKQFAKIQAGFQILRGGIEVVTQLAAAYRALSAAQAASAVVGSGGAGAAGAAGGAAKVGGSLAAGGLATGGLIAGGKALAGGLALFEGVQFARRSFGDKSDSSESFVGASISTLKTYFIELGRSAQAVADAEKKRLVVIEAVKQAETARLSILGQSQAGLEGIAGRRDRALGLTDEASAMASRNRGLSALDQAEAQYANIRPDNTAGQIAGLQNILSIKEQIASADESSLEANRRNLEAIQGNLKAAEQLLKTTQERVKSEASAVKSSLAKFGELDPTKQQSIAKISEKIQAGGQINDAEARFLKGTGFGGKLVEDFYAQKGAAAGGGAALAGLGEMDALAKAKADEVAAAQQVAKLKAEEQEAIKKTSEASQRLVESLDKLAEALNNLTTKQLQGVEENRDEAINPGAKAAAVIRHEEQKGMMELAWSGVRSAAGVQNAFE